jgi:hypothetical protein
VWSGTWRNETFGSTGSLQLAFQPKGTDAFTFGVTVGGNALGCTVLPQASGAVTKGTGANHWNPDGFDIEIAVPGGVKASVVYDFKTAKLTGSGTGDCNPGISWKLDGTFSGNTFFTRASARSCWSPRRRPGA